MVRMLSDAVRLARSGLMDREYYQAQTGLRFGSAFAVARHFLRDGAEAGLSPHPLFEPALLAPTESDVAALMVEYVAHPERFADHTPHPLFDLARARGQLRERGLSRKPNAWIAWVSTATVATPVPTAKKLPSLPWGDVRRSLIQAAAQWRSGARSEPAEGPVTTGPAPDQELTSIIVPVAVGLDATLRQPRLTGNLPHLEVVCVGAMSRAQYCCLGAIGLTRRTRPVLAPPIEGDDDLPLPELWNLGASQASGSRLVFLAPNVTIGSAAIADLAAALDDAATAVAQPLNEQPDMTIASAGALYATNDRVPDQLLRGHPISDAEPLAGRPLPAAHSAVLAIRSAAFAALGGFGVGFDADHAGIDLSLRAAQAGLGQTTLAIGSRATVRPLPDGHADNGSSADLLRRRHPVPPDGTEEALRACGFALSSGEVTRPRLGVDALPSLRWTIDTPVTAGWWADSWGDWHYAHSLARALRRLGQQVAVDTRQARERETRRFDDVLLTLRGMDDVRPAGAPVNLMWIIYGPEQVSAEEAARYDQVFASSISWSQQRTEEWGLPIRPLLQCTDTELFHPGRAGSEPEGGVLFVGNARREGARPMVDAALASGIDMRLYGTGWEDVPAAAGRLTGVRVANRELGRHYAQAGIVLNDHLETMRRAGFVSNRLFDAVACGARVLSDPIDGAAELFGDSVVCCEPAHVADILTAPWDDHWPSAERRLANSERIRAEHSFDQRAQVLLDAAVGVLSQ